VESARPVARDDGRDALWFFSRNVRVFFDLYWIIDVRVAALARMPRLSVDASIVSMSLP